MYSLSASGPRDRTSLPITRSQLAVLLLILVVQVTTAAAETIHIVASGDPSALRAVEQAGARGLTRNGHQLGEPHLSDAVRDGLADCFVMNDEACAQTVFAQTSAGALLYFMVEAQLVRQSQNITVSGWYFLKGQPVLSDRRYCERCNESDVRLAVEQLAVALTTPVAVEAPRLKIVSSPAGALVHVDAQPIGATPLEQQIAPGPHQIALSKPGFEPLTTSVTVGPSGLTPLELTLRPARLPTATPHRRWPAWAMASGAILLATGVTLWIIDEDDDGQKLYFRNSAPLGIGLTAAGALTLGVGVGAWRLGRPSNPPGATSTVGARGLTLSFASTF